MKYLALILIVFIAGCTYFSETIVSGKDMKYGFSRGKDLKIKRITCIGNCEAIQASIPTE